MNTWTDLLIQHVNSETHTQKRTDRTDNTPLDDSCVSFGSSFPDASQDNYDAEAVLERAAIMEYDGCLTRNTAEAMAAQDADGRRPRAYGDTQQAAAQYQQYIALWEPNHPGDIPSPPPNTSGNGCLWEAFWSRVGKQNH